MATLNEIAYDYLELIRKHISDDEHIDLRSVKYWIHNQRALWLDRQLSRQTTIDENVQQDIGCVDLEIIDRSACPVNAPIGCYIRRSTKKIPKPMKLKDRLAITRVGPLDIMMQAYNFVTYKRAQVSGNGRFNKEGVYAFYYQGYLYLWAKKTSNIGNLIDCVHVRGVFENPEEVGEFKNPDGSQCYTEESDYPINRSLLDYMKDQIINSNIKIKMVPPSDSSNNAESDVRQ